jgi:hypothetical protein
MLITVVAVLCHISVGYCVEEIVTDSDTTPGLTFTGCSIGAQAPIVEWMAHTKYATGWRLDRYKCIPGHYEVRGRA